MRFDRLHIILTLAKEDAVQRDMQRSVDWDESSRLVALAIGVFTLPPEAANDVDAIVVYPGQGEIGRVTDAIDRWQRPTSRARHFIMPGVNTTAEQTEKPLDRERFAELGMTRFEGIMIREFAENTFEETQWLADQVHEFDIRSIGLTTAPYHLLRAYLVLIQVLMLKGIWIPVIPLPTAMPLHGMSPENGVPMWDMIPGEIARIVKYGAQGDVALLPDLQRYMQWLWQQPMIKNRATRTIG